MMHHHFLPHEHNGEQHRAHLISPTSLFLYFQIFVAVSAGIFLLKLALPNVLGTVTFSASEIVSFTNAKRAESDLAELVENPKLAAAAHAKARDMFEVDYWAHNSPKGKTPWTFITIQDYKYVFAGENLARDFSDASSVVNAWMNSPSHKSNLLDKNFKEIGVAVESGKLGGREGILVVQMFGATNQPVFAQKSLQTTDYRLQNGPVVSVRGEQTVAEAVAPSFRGQIAASRAFSLLLLGSVMVLFVVEIVYSLRREHLRLSTSVVAHVAMLGFVLLAVWYSASGAVI